MSKQEGRKNSLDKRRTNIMNNKDLMRKHIRELLHKPRLEMIFLKPKEPRLWLSPKKIFGLPKRPKL